MKTICSLRFKEAIAAIQGTETVMYRHGVWNEYSLCKTEDAIKGIQRSGYGADVKYDEDKKMFYVSVPAACDMW